MKSQVFARWISGLAVATVCAFAPIPRAYAADCTADTPLASASLSAGALKALNLSRQNYSDTGFDRISVSDGQTARIRFSCSLANN